MHFAMKMYTQKVKLMPKQTINSFANGYYTIHNLLLTPKQAWILPDPSPQIGLFDEYSSERILLNGTHVIIETIPS